MADEFAEAILIKLVNHELIDVFQLFGLLHAACIFSVDLAEEPETAHQAVVSDQFIYQCPQFFLAHAVIDEPVDAAKLFDLCHVALN